MSLRSRLVARAKCTPSLAQPGAVDDIRAVLSQLIELDEQASSRRAFELLNVALEFVVGDQESANEGLECLREILDGPPLVFVDIVARERGLLPWPAELAHLNTRTRRYAVRSWACRECQAWTAALGVSSGEHVSPMAGLETAEECSLCSVERQGREAVGREWGLTEKQVRAGSEPGFVLRWVTSDKNRAKWTREAGAWWNGQ